MPKHSTDFTTKLVNGLLGIDPLARLLKHQARSMMIKRAETIGVFWHQEANALRWRDAASDSHSADVGQEVAAGWLETFKTVTRPELDYPSYYLLPIHER